MSSTGRLVDRLTDHWNRLCGEEFPPPSFSRFQKGTIGDVWDQCAVLKVEPGNADSRIFQFADLGDKVSDIVGKNMLGKHVSTNKNLFKAASIIGYSDRVVNTSEPCYDEGKFVNDRNKIIKYRSCLLPYGSTEGGVTHILVGLSWREF